MHIFDLFTPGSPYLPILFWCLRDTARAVISTEWVEWSPDMRGSKPNIRKLKINGQKLIKLVVSAHFHIKGIVLIGRFCDSQMSWHGFIFGQLVRAKVLSEPVSDVGMQLQVQRLHLAPDDFL